jgi:hypothetical protein
MAKQSTERAESRLPKLAGLPNHIQQLERLVGSWTVNLRWSPSTHKLVGGPREIELPVEFGWLDSTPWLQYRFGPARWLIGGDEADRQFVVLYTDDRPALRVYRMTLERNIWKIWRNAPGFRQRFEGRLLANDRKIVAHWDKAEGTKPWTLDFDLVFRR